MLGCCFVSFHFLWAILCLQAVIAIYIVGVNYQSRWVDTIRHALQWVSDRKSAESEENRTDDAQAAAWFTLARLWVASWAAGVNYVIQTSSWDLVRLHESVVRSTEKIKVQRLQPSIPSVSQGGGCGITLFRNCANHPHKTFPKRTLLSWQLHPFWKGFVRLTVAIPKQSNSTAAALA